MTVKSVVYYDPSTSTEDATTGGWLAVPASVSANAVAFYMLYYAGDQTTDGTPFETINSVTDMATIWAEAVGR